jgi:hypothetical protein
MSGRAKPRLPEFLGLLEAVTARVSDLLSELVAIEQLPSLRAIHERRDAARRLAYEEPWTEAILRVLETSDYQSADPQPGYVADQLGIELEVEQRCLAKLQQAGIVVHEAGRYACVSSLTVDTRATPTLKCHWSAQARLRIPAPSPDDFFGYNVFSVSEADLARIRELLRAAFREIRSLVAATPGAERVAVTNVQLLCWPRSDRASYGAPSRQP